MSGDDSARLRVDGFGPVKLSLIWLLTVGILWRVMRYLLCFPFWLDEACQNINILHRGYAELIEPLGYYQVAPLAYLWLERAVLEWLGGGEYAMRFPSLVMGIAALLLFWRLARRQLEPLAACLAVGLFAVTYGLVRASCESKPYAADVLVSTVIVWAATRWIAVPGSMQRCATSAAAIALGLWLSFPAVFVACGVAAATLVRALRARRARIMGYWFATQALVTASAAIYWYVFLSAQTAQAEGTYLENFWQQRGAFPPLESVGGFLGWLIAVHCGNMLAYPQGGNTFGSTAPAFLLLIGLIAFVRTGRAHLALIVVGALAANLIAAGAQGYPYGTAVRIALYLAPLICLTVGQGGQAVLEWFARRSHKRAPLGAVVCILFAFAALGVARDLLTPYKHVDYFNIRAAVQDVVGRAQPADVFVVLNHDGNMGRRPIPAHQVMRYYIELLTGRSAIYPDGGSIPADARWVLRYTGYDSPSEQETRAAIANAGLELVGRWEFALGDRWDTRIIAYHGAPTD